MGGSGKISRKRVIRQNLCEGLGEGHSRKRKEQCQRPAEGKSLVGSRTSKNTSVASGKCDGQE